MMPFSVIVTMMLASVIFGITGVLMKLLDRGFYGLDVSGWLYLISGSLMNSSLWGLILMVWLYR